MRQATLDAETITRTIPATVAVTPRFLAETFAEMSDEAQAQFFIEVAEIAARWHFPPAIQWGLIGAHLRTCTCSTEEARHMIREIARAVEADESGVT